MRKEKIYYKVYDTELKDYVYRITQNSFINLEFNSIEEARSYDDGWLRDKTRYEVHKFTRVISSDCVNYDPPTEEDFKLKEKKLKKEADYARRMEEYLSKFNPRDEMEKEMLRLQFTMNEALEEMGNDIKKNLFSFRAETQKEINSLADLFDSIEENYFKDAK